MDNLQPTSSPLERLETTTEALVLSQQQSSKQTIETLKGLEPVMEALVVSYADGAKKIVEAVESIQDYLGKIEPVAVNDKMLPLLKKLDNTFNRRNIFTIPEPTVIQDSKETVKAIRDLIETVDLKPMEVNFENDFTQLEKALGRIEKLVRIDIPLDDGRVKVKLSDEDLKRISQSFSFPMSVGTASEETLLAIKSLLNVYIHNETPTGAVNGSNQNFTTAYDYKTGTTKLFLNGLRQREGIGYDYIENGTNRIQLLNPPITEDILIIDYIKN